MIWEIKGTLVPASYAGIMLGGFVMAVIVSSSPTVWPSALGSQYPSRPVFQLAAALSTLPHILQVFLWYIRTGSKRILLTGSGRFFLITTSYFVTSADSHSHGTWSLGASVVTIFWMYLIWRKASSHVKARKNILIGYVLWFLLGLQFLSHYIATGTDHSWFSAARAICFLLDIGFDSLGVKEFDSVSFGIDYTRDFGV